MRHRLSSATSLFMRTKLSRKLAVSTLLLILKRHFCFQQQAKPCTIIELAQARLAQSAERKALNLVVMASRLTVAVFLKLFVVKPEHGRLYPLGLDMSNCMQHVKSTLHTRPVIVGELKEASRADLQRD